MMPRFCFVRCLTVVALLTISASLGHAENWPGWRGPRGDGTSAEANIPTRWDATTGENIAWQAEIPGDGHASPIVWNDHIFLTTCLTESQERVLLCIDRRSGKLRWQQTVFKAPLETKHVRNSFASGTPATDGELVYVAFLEVSGSTVPAPNVGKARPVTPGSMLVAAYDFDGRKRWLVRPGEFTSVHGFCSCPVLYKNLVIVNGDHDGESYIVALDKTSGQTVWKVPRQHKTRSYVTPIIRTIDGQDQLVFSGSKSVVSLDPATGETIWTIDGPTEQFVASMVFDGERFFMAAGFPTYHVRAIRPEGKGNVTESHVAWHEKNAKCYVPSPVVVDGYLLVADDRGTGNCYDAQTGERYWQARLGRGFGSSLVTAGGLVYFPADDGLTKVIKPGKEVEILSENPIGELTNSSPAISQGQIFLRGEKHLFCIGKAGAAR
jgi:outer membrane protein assembly factor BamB